MRQAITWEETKGDTINGFGIKIHYLYTSFDPVEIDKLRKWCMEHIDSGVVVEGQMADCDFPIGKAESEGKE